MAFELAEITYDAYVEDSPSAAAIVEERINGDDFRSPSVQLRVTPLGELELLSTHDQLLGGPSGQSLPRLRLPRRPRTTPPRSRARPSKVGERLAEEGVIGRFALDFVVVRSTRTVGHVRDRAQPAQGRDDAPVPDAAVPDRRHLRPGDRRLHRAVGHAEVLRRDRPRREPPRTGAHARRPLRHRRPPRAALRPVARRPASSST